MSIHKSTVDGAGLVVDQSPDLGTAGVLVAAPHEQLPCNLFVRDNDELLSDHAGLVDGTKLVCPLLELAPHVEPGEVVDAAHDGILLGSREPTRERVWDREVAIEACELG